MNFKKLPKTSEVIEVDMGRMKASVIELTDENHAHVLEMVLSMCLGEQCQFCLRRFETLDDLKGSVWAPWEHGRIAHKPCWDSRRTP